MSLFAPKGMFQRMDKRVLGQVREKSFTESLIVLYSDMLYNMDVLCSLLCAHAYLMWSVEDRHMNSVRCVMLRDTAE